MNQKMSSIPTFRDFICDRLSAAAEEIFRMFEKTVLEYEEALGRQRRPLDTESKPQTHELPQQHAVKQEQEEGLIQHQLSFSRSSLCQEDREPSCIKEEPEDLCTSQHEEPLVLKQETNIILETAACEKDGLSENRTLYLDQSESHCSTAEEASSGNMIIKMSEVLDPNNKNLLIFNRDSSESRDNTQYQFEVSKTFSSSRHQRKKSSKCEICGKIFNHRSDFIRHQRIHTGVKPYSCNMCGKGFNQSSMLTDHKRVHTGDKPYPCDFCGKKFNRKSAVMVHRRVHTGEKPFSCHVCAEVFISSTMLKRHIQKHTGEKLFPCLICGQQFHQQSELKIHTRVHMQ
ncbi:zinc finger protein 84-like isoform X3 [Salarias fasciatus]|uniref:zinc finger protein 84-like isoform X3 n=1 Tax=Salarias fasciatus TaxID=181472 RepID=UPI0011766F17|nr:zinc finger protein 84-like isoform X3 [Salarias fasciatus]